MRARKQALGRHELRIRPGGTKPPFTVRFPPIRLRQSGPLLQKKYFHPGTCCPGSSWPRRTSYRVDTEATMRSWHSFGDAQKTPVPARQVAGEGRPGLQERDAGFGSTHSRRPVATSGRTWSQDAEAWWSTEDGGERSEPTSRGHHHGNQEGANRHQPYTPPSTGYGPAARRTSSFFSRTTPSTNILGRKSLPRRRGELLSMASQGDLQRDVQAASILWDGTDRALWPESQRTNGSASRCSTELTADCQILGVLRSLTFLKQQ